MPDQNKDATGTTPVATSYDEAVKAAAGVRAATDWPGTPVPDTPRGALHLNPALTPAPERQVIPERQPVPVINDPGVVGANPPLGMLNAQVRADGLGVAVDKLPPTEAGMVAPADIKAAAEQRQADIAQRIDEKVGKEVSAAHSEPEPVSLDHGEDAHQSPDVTKAKAEDGEGQH